MLPCGVFNFGKPKTVGDWIVHVAGAVVAGAPGLAGFETWDCCRRHKCGVRSITARRNRYFYPDPMPLGLERWHGGHDLHFITFSCYRRQPLPATARVSNPRETRGTLLVTFPPRLTKVQLPNLYLRNLDKTTRCTILENGPPRRPPESGVLSLQRQDARSSRA